MFIHILSQLKFPQKTLLSVIALGCEPNAAWLSLLTGPSPNPTKPIHLPRPHMGTIPWSTLSYLVTWLNLWAPSFALQFFLSSSLTISSVPEFLYPVTSYSHPQSPTRPKCWSRFRPPHLLFSPIQIFAPAWPPGL